MEEKEAGEHLWALVERVHARQSRLERDPNAGRVRPGSELAADDRKSKPYQVSHAAHHALMAAVDHLHCLRSSMAGQRSGNRQMLTFHQQAQFALVRGGLENACRAVWMLAPQRRNERIRRRLALYMSELSAKAALVRDMGGNVSEVDARREEIRQMAVDRGLVEDPGQVKKELHFPGYGEVVFEAGRVAAGDGSQARAIWRGCSALAHGDTWGTLAFLEREIEASTPEVYTARVTCSVDHLYSMALVAESMMRLGFGYFDKRGKRAAV